MADQGESAGHRPDRGHGAPPDTGRVGYHRATLNARLPQPATRTPRLTTTRPTQHHPGYTPSSQSHTRKRTYK